MSGDRIDGSTWADGLGSLEGKVADWLKEERDSSRTAWVMVGWKGPPWME